MNEKLIFNEECVIILYIAKWMITSDMYVKGANKKNVIDGIRTRVSRTQTKEFRSVWSRFHERWAPT